VLTDQEKMNNALKAMLFHKENNRPRHSIMRTKMEEAESKSFERSIKYEHTRQTAGRPAG